MRAPAILARNWGLKILALVLAIVVYYAMRDAVAAARYRDPPSFMKGPAA